MSRRRDNAIGFLRSLVRAFFRHVEVTGLENVPANGGGLVVAWHPNGVIDPVLMATQSPRPIVFGARHGLFSVPLLGSLMRAVGTVPIYRAADAPQDASGGGGEAERREKNRQSLDALASAVAHGSLTALFPEGVSHDAPHLAELKFGAAKLFLRAIELTSAGAPAPVILPVGLHYDDKSVFRSRVLVHFHPPVTLPDELLRGSDANDEKQTRARVAALTERIEAALVEAVHPTESWELHRVMHRTRTLVRAERGRRAGVSHEPDDMPERIAGFERVWRGYYACRERDPAAAAALLTRVELYDMELDTLGLLDTELDDDPSLISPWLPVLFVLQALLVYALLPPILMAGYVLNAIPYFLLDVIAKRVSKEPKDLASVKMFGGMFLFPLAWGLVGILAARGVLDLHARFPAVPERPWLAAFSTVALAIAGGFVALRYAELSKETLRSLRVRFTRRRYAESVERLRAERSELTDAITALTQGIDLPGQLERDGRVRSARG